MRVRLQVFRHDPQNGSEAAFQNFDLELDPEETVAGALVEIQETHDPSLAFRFICNMKKCGECAMLVNQKPVLACQKKVETELEVEPLPNLPLIIDYKMIPDPRQSQLPYMVLGKSFWPNVCRYRAVMDNQISDLAKRPQGVTSGFVGRQTVCDVANWRFR